MIHNDTFYYSNVGHMFLMGFYQKKTREFLEKNKEKLDWDLSGHFLLWIYLLL